MWARGKGGRVRQHEGGKVSACNRGWVRVDVQGGQEARVDGGDRANRALGKCVLVRQGVGSACAPRG
jgi:hypothetical protein